MDAPACPTWPPFRREWTNRQHETFSLYAIVRGDISRPDQEPASLENPDTPFREALRQPAGDADAGDAGPDDQDVEVVSFQSRPSTVFRLCMLKAQIASKGN
mgnify:CR=1 FL=1